MINIDGMWTSKNGLNKIRIIQSEDKFEGYVGNENMVKISLGTISERTLNFKQSWHKGVNKGAVATVYGRLTEDNAHILLQFQGMRADGREIKGKNAIYRDNFIGAWIPKGGVSGDTWHFNLVNEREVTGHLHSKHFKDPMPIVGRRNQENGNFFVGYLQVSSGSSEEIRGEYSCPNLILSLPRNLGNQHLFLVRKPPQRKPLYVEYEDESSSTKESMSNEINRVQSISLSSKKRPCRKESNIVNNQSMQPAPFLESSNNDLNREDMRSALLCSYPLQAKEKRNSVSCCWSMEICFSCCCIL